MITILNTLKDLLEKEGADLVGFCSLAEIPEMKDKGYNLGISIAIAVDSVVINNIKSGVTIEYYNECKKIDNKLEELSKIAANYLKSNGYETDCWGATDDRVDEATYTTPLPHKTVAVKSGLGWIGKCSLLITEKYGSAVRLITVLSNMECEDIENEQLNTLCNSCRACVENCPANAVEGQNWTMGATREEILNFRKCRETARRIAKERIGIEHTYCGRCIVVCPYTLRYIERMKAD